MLPPSTSQPQVSQILRAAARLKPVSASGHERSRRPSFATSELKVTLTRLELLLVDLAAHVRPFSRPVSRRSRSALPMTDTELNVIAALATIGLSRRPVHG